MQRFPSASLVVLVLALLTTGCASHYGAQQTAVNYYPQCYRPIQDLRSHEHDVAKGTATGVTLGTLGGAALGFLLSGGRWQGAVAGAATGAVAGGLTGGMHASRQKEIDENKRLAAYLQDIEGDISDLDIVSASAKTSLQCYDQQFASLLAAIKSKAISRDEAQRRFAEISSGREEAIALMGDAVTRGRDLEQQYEAAFVQEERALNAKPRQARHRTRNSTLHTAKQQRKVLQTKVGDLSKEKSAAEQETSAHGEAYRRACEDYEDSKV